MIFRDSCIAAGLRTKGGRRISMKASLLSVFGICNTWSELTPCNVHLREISESVKRGAWEAGARKYGRMDLSRPALVAWIKDSHRHCALRRAAEWARMADRFLDWLKTNRHISHNPFEDLCS